MNDIIITYKTMQEESSVRLKIRDRYEYEVIPVPRQISVTCGIAQKLPYDSFKDVCGIILNMFNNGELFDTDVHFYKELGNDKYEQFLII